MTNEALIETTETANAIQQVQQIAVSAQRGASEGCEEAARRWAAFYSARKPAFSRRSARKWTCTIGHDPNNASVATFPFAFILYISFILGGLSILWGLLLMSVWLAT